MKRRTNKNRKSHTPPKDLSPYEYAKHFRSLMREDTKQGRESIAGFAKVAFAYFELEDIESGTFMHEILNDLQCKVEQKKAPESLEGVTYYEVSTLENSDLIFSFSYEQQPATHL